MAVWPARNAARFSTKPNCSTPGGMNLFSARISAKYLDAHRRVDRRLHGVAVEEAAALVAEAFLEHEHRVGRLAEERGAVHLGRVFVGQELADLRELLPGLRRGEIVAELGLELGLVRRIVEDVLPIVEDEHVAVIGKSVYLPVHEHLVVAIGRRDQRSSFLEAVLVDDRGRALRARRYWRDRASRRE